MSNGVAAEIAAPAVMCARPEELECPHSSGHRS
jgi:hypothetical protein